MHRKIPIPYSIFSLVLVVFLCGYWLLSQQQKEVFENIEAETGLNANNFFVGGQIAVDLANNFSFSAFGGRNFCSYYSFNQTENIYPKSIWGVCSEHYQQTGQILTGLVLSSPFQIVFDESTQAEKWLPVSESTYPASTKTGIETVLLTKNKELADAYFSGVEKVLDIKCEGQSDCENTLPMEYALRSNCPYEVGCVDGQCAVICPWKNYNQ